MSAGTQAERRGQSTAPGVLFEARWGSDESAIGRAPADESNPEGPMAFAFGDDGALWILDQANQRLLRLPRGATKPERLRMPLLAAQDLRIAKNGNAVVLDRLGDAAVHIASPKGEAVATISLAGKGVREGGGITGVFMDGDEIYVEREHGKLVHLGNARGEASAAREEMIGRPAADGRTLLNAGIVDRMSVFVTALDRSSGAQRFTRLVGFAEPVQYVLELDGDRTGLVYLAVVTGTAGRSRIVVHCLSGEDGAPSGRVELAPSPLADEVFREIAVKADGGFAYAERSDRGVKYTLHACR
ncbi:MAG: hypothetical protein IT381_25690 [Deltaproteobacteria bacterium]|nr:hypothetical protein [Deltaproteobacteria bacterium]